MYSRQLEIVNDFPKIMNFQYIHKKFKADDYQDLNIPGDLYDITYPFHSDFFLPSFLGPMFKVM